MKTLKYTEIFIFPLLTIILVVGLLHYNLKSIESVENSISQLPTADEFTSKLTLVDKNISNESMHKYSSSMLKLLKNTFKANIKSLTTTRNSFYLILLIVLIWFIHSLYVYKKIIKAQKALTKSSSGTTNP